MLVDRMSVTKIAFKERDPDDGAHSPRRIILGGNLDSDAYCRLLCGWTRHNQLINSNRELI